MGQRCFRIVVGVLALGAVPAVQAQHEQTHEHGKPAEFKMPTTFKNAVIEIRLRMLEIDGLMSTKKLDQVHSSADVIRKVGNVLGQLALQRDSTVPKEAVKEVNKAGRDLAASFDAIDKAADGGDGVATRKVYEGMTRLVEILLKYVPPEYACPMRCETDKVYPKPDPCPKCGMRMLDVIAHRDHEAKHGGGFFMTSDQMHHLEGTLSVEREFRIYFYDEFTKPIPADRFSAVGKAGAQGKDDDHRDITFQLSPDKAFLTARVDPSVPFPIAAKVFIDFKDGKKPQVFDFGFSEPSKEPSPEGGGGGTEKPDDHPAGHGGGE